MVKTMAKLRMAHASTHGARKPPGPKNREKKDQTMVITMAKLRIAHASTHGARKSPGPKVSVNNGHLRLLIPPCVAHAKSVDQKCTY